MGGIEYIFYRTFFGIALLCFPYLTCSAQKLPSPEPYFISIIARDFNKSLEWYTEVFEMEVVSRVENEERGFKQANLKGPHLLIELLSLNNTSTLDTRVTGFYKFGLIVDNFDAWIRKFRKLEVEFNGDIVKDPTSGKSMVIIKDPDGNRIQIFSR